MCWGVGSQELQAWDRADKYLGATGSGDNELSVGGLLTKEVSLASQSRLGHKCQWRHCTGVLESQPLP